MLDKASRRPQCLFAESWEPGTFRAPPELPALRAAILLVARAAHLEVWQGRPEQATRWLAVGLRIAKHTGAEPTLLAQMVHVGMINTLALRTGREVLCEAAPPTPETVQLDQALANQEVKSSFLMGLRAERIWGLEMSRQVAAEPVASTLKLLGLEGGPHLDLLFKLYFSPLGQPLRRYDELCSLRVWDRVESALSRPYGESPVHLSTLRAYGEPNWAAPLTWLSITLFERTVQNRDLAEADLPLWRIALKLKEYKAAHGQYPNSLDELQAGLPWKIPEDSFSGKAFGYRKEGAGFVVYSLGPDMKDDWGRLDYNRAESDHQTGDIVWRCER